MEDTQTLPLDIAALKSAIAFRAYLARFSLSLLDVSLATRSRLPLAVLWRAAHGYAIHYQSAVRIRAALYALTGVPYTGQIHVF